MSIKTFFSKISKYRRSLLWSIFGALVINFACILQDNWESNILDDIDLFAKLLHYGKAPQYDMSDVLLLDVAHDKTVAKSDSVIVGLHCQDAITDRGILLQCLQKAENINYKCIFIDVIFDKRLKTCVDDSLIAQIRKMNDSPRKVFITKPQEHRFVFDDRLNDWAVTNHYPISDLYSNFTRYVFLKEDVHSAALAIYNSIHSPKIEPIHLFTLGKDSHHPVSLYWYDSHFFKNAPTVRISKGRERDTFLGPSFLSDEEYDDDERKKAMEGKIIIVGDFVNDKHSTYAGEKPGAYLTYFAYNELENGNYIIGWKFLIWMTILYSSILFFIVNDGMLCRIINKGGRWINSTLKRYNIPSFPHFFPTSLFKKPLSLIRVFAKVSGSLIINFIGYSFILSIIAIWLYQDGIVYSTIIPAGVFSIVKFIKSLYKSIQYNKEQ